MERKMWKRGEIIREKGTAHPFLVIHVHKDICTMVVDLEDHRKLPTAYAVLPREYSDYALDEEMETKASGWTFAPIL